MDASTFAAAVAAGIVYVVTLARRRSPACITATMGAGAVSPSFLGFHGVGDATWSALALAALMGRFARPRPLPPARPACGLYLIVLGLRAIVSRLGRRR